MATADSVEIINSLNNVHVFLIINQNAHAIWPVKREIQSTKLILTRIESPSISPGVFNAGWIFY
jgi:hypothetical protein